MPVVGQLGKFTKPLIFLPSICIYMIFKTNNALMFLKRELFNMFVMNSIEPVSVSYFSFDGLTFYIIVLFISLG